MYVSSYLHNKELTYLFAVMRNNKYKYPSQKPNPLAPFPNAKSPLCRPSLELLNNIPFTIPFNICVSIVRNFVMNDMVSKGVVRPARYSHLGTLNKAKIQVHRE